MATRRRRTNDAAEIIRQRYFEGNAELLAILEEERANAEIARVIIEMRTQAGLTQQQLAERIGTGQPTIARLEDSDYEGHSLGMLRRIAHALNLRIELRFVPTEAA